MSVNKSTEISANDGNLYKKRPSIEASYHPGHKS